MNNKVGKYYNADYQALFEELKARYGQAIARHIVDQIINAEVATKTPDILLVKACCDMVELFRGDARALLRQIKILRDQSPNTEPKVIHLEKRKLETEFRRIYRHYWVTMKIFYPLYRRALAAYDAPPRFSYSSTETKMAA